MVAVAFTHTRGWDAVLFPVGVRLSTWLALAAFPLLALLRRDGRALGAAAAWFFGFEGAYQATALVTGNGLPALGVAAPILVVVGAVAVAIASRARILPAWRVMTVVAAVWIAWVAIGFPANAATLAGFNPMAEVLNEAAKTLWALAYLWPLVRVGAARASAAGVARAAAQPSLVTMRR
jgi:hypothetical protein